jgi:hypothetical protein
MSLEHGSKIVFVGGSSTGFSVDSQLMLSNYNLPVVNYGTDAGVGAVTLTESTLPNLRRGDTLIVDFQFGMLEGSMENESLSLQFCLAMGHPEWASNPALGIGKASRFELAASLRPGGYHLFTMLGKVVQRREMFRYKLSDYSPGGWIQTSVRNPMTGPADMGSLSPDAIAFLHRLHDWCEQHGVRSAFTLPRLYSPPELASKSRALNARHLRQVQDIFPVLKDPWLGVDTNAIDFGDMEAHLTATAADVRSHQLAQSIVHWDIWTTNELDALAQCPPASAH